MATLKFYLRGKSKKIPIYLVLSNGRDNTFYRKTGLLISPNDWSKATGLPKENSPENKNLKSVLKNLQSFAYDNLNKAEANGETINGDWLQEKINLHFNRETKTELHYIVEYGEYFIENLKYRVNPKGNKGVAVATEKKYRTIVNKLVEFQKEVKKRYLLKEIDLAFRSGFIKFLSDSDKLNDNTIGRYLKFVKSICLDAQKNGFEVSGQLLHFKGYTVKPPKITLSFAELEKIKETNLVSENHQITRDWLIIGCYTGQRVSDLLRMNKTFVENIMSYDFIVLEQVKTNKIVQIPLHPEVKAILDKRKGEFPPLFTKNMDSNKAMFNKYLKEVCKLSKINEVVEGNYFDPEKKRTILGNYEKYKLISSHICRRSFATNFYGNRTYPTPLLMNITAHGTEKMFLEYIGKKPIDYSLQLAQIWTKEALKESSNKAQMKVIKNAGNE